MLVFMLSTCEMFVRPIPESYTLVWVPLYVNLINYMESGQRCYNVIDMV